MISWDKLVVELVIKERPTSRLISSSSRPALDSAAKAVPNRLVYCRKIRRLLAVSIWYRLSASVQRLEKRGWRRGEEEQRQRFDYVLYSASRGLVQVVI